MSILEQRHAGLAKYNFTCNCTACRQGWPTLDKLERKFHNLPTKMYVESVGGKDAIKKQVRESRDTAFQRHKLFQEQKSTQFRTPFLAKYLKLFHMVWSILFQVLSPETTFFWLVTEIGNNDCMLPRRWSGYRRLTTWLPRSFAGVMREALTSRDFWRCPSVIWTRSGSWSSNRTTPWSSRRTSSTTYSLLSTPPNQTLTTACEVAHGDMKIDLL